MGAPQLQQRILEDVSIWLSRRRSNYIRCASLLDQRSGWQNHWCIDVHRHGEIGQCGYTQLVWREDSVKLG